jgi:hypothetical protein
MRSPIGFAADSEPMRSRRKEENDVKAIGVLVQLSDF